MGDQENIPQAIWRKVQLLGLAEEYKAENQVLKRFVQKMAAVSFCPPAFVRPAWLAIQQEAPDLLQGDQLVTYFDNTWLNGQFSSEAGTTLTTRTNNHVEGWHSRLKNVVEKPQKLQAFFDCFNAGETSLEDYLEAIKYQTGL